MTGAASSSDPSKVYSFSNSRLQGLAAVCKEKGYLWEDLDPHGYMVRIRNNEKFFIVAAGRGCAFPVNSAWAVALAKDKAYTSFVLESENLRVPQGRYFFLNDAYERFREEGASLRDARDYGRQMGYPLVVKPNEGSSGRGVWLVETEEEMIRLLVEMGTKERIGLVQKFIQGREYRLLYACGELIYWHEKTRPNLVGDGIHDVRYLLDMRNEDFHTRGLDLVALEPNAFLRREMEKRGLSPQSVLPKGVLLPYTIRANYVLLQDGPPPAIKEAAPAALRALCAKATEALGLSIAGVDLFVDWDKPFEDPCGWTILEVNGNPGLLAPLQAQRHDLLFKIWEKITHRFFGA